MSLAPLNAKLAKHARNLVYLFSFVLAVLTWFFYTKDGAAGIQTANAFGFLAFTFFSFALAVTPVMKIWPKLSMNPSIYMARRAFGVSAFVFALFHALIQFFITFKGNPAVPLNMILGGRVGLLAGYLVLAVLFPLAVTSTNFAVNKLGKKWFALHKLAYLGYPLLVFHAVNIGLDFKDGKINLYSGTFLIAAGLTMSLEFVRLFKEWKNQRTQSAIKSGR